MPIKKRTMLLGRRHGSVIEDRRLSSAIRLKRRKSKVRSLQQEQSELNQFNNFLTNDQDDNLK